VNLERVVQEIDRATRRLERPLTRELRDYLNRALARLNDELIPAYRDALALSGSEGRILREARARAIITQLQAAIRAIDVSDPETGVPQALQRAIQDSFREGAREARTIFERASRDMGLPARGLLGAEVPLEAVVA
jgi:hypothetical protein